jgi:hypothetical protein
LKIKTKTGEDFKRVRDEESESLVRIGWQYISKSEWKSKVRDIDKQEQTKKEKKQ